MWTKLKKRLFGIGLVGVLLLMASAVYAQGVEPQHSDSYWYATYWNNVSLTGAPAHQALVDRLDEILAVPGVDMVQWGPSDYSMSSGLDKGSDEVKRVERTVIEKSLAAGVPPRIELMGMEGIETYLDLGVRHFRMGTDMAILKRFWQTQGDALRERLAKL